MSKNSFNTVFFCIFSLLIISFTMSCRKDLAFETSNQALRFSQDTVFLDTIFTQSNSETYLLKVYNDSNDDISLENVYLNQRQNSVFRVNLDGRSGFEFSEVPLRAKDSLMVFVEVAIADTNNDFIEEDKLVFENSNQEITLLAMTEEAIYHYPNPNEDFININENTQWNNNASHVVYGTVKLAEGATFNIQEGTKVYFHNNSGMEINGTLNLNGTLDKPISIRGDRHDARYDSLPKQWNEIKMNENSTLNANYAILKGGTNGFHLNKGSANIINTQIYNMSSSGIFAKNATVFGANIVVADAADACLNVEDGGTYNFYYATFANAWNGNVSGISGINVPAYLSNYTNDESGNETQSNFYGNFANCIFYGRHPNGVYLDNHDGANFNYNFDSCLIKNEDASLADFSSSLNEEPLFYSNIFSDHNLKLQDDSPGTNAGNSFYNSFAEKDIKGVLRGGSPNIGAYER